MSGLHGLGFWYTSTCSWEVLAAIHVAKSVLCVGPAKILSPFLPTAPLQYVPKIRFTQATVDGVTTDKTMNAFHNETVILNYIGGDPISDMAWVINHL